MSFDIVLIAIVVAGIGLSAAYIRAEYLRWRELGASERRRESALRALHAARLSEQQNTTFLPSVFRLQGFGHDDAANPERTAGIGRGAALDNSALNDPFTERRKRERKRAGQ